VNLQAVISFLSGKKTYLVGVAGVVYAYGIGRHWWPSDAEIWGIIGSTGAMTFRAALARFAKQVVGAPEIPLGGTSTPAQGEKLFGQTPATKS
jgi:hypothetical protein